MLDCPLGTKAFEEAVACSTRSDTDTDGMHTTRAVPNVRIPGLVLVNPAVSPAANIVNPKERPFLSSG